MIKCTTEVLACEIYAAFDVGAQHSDHIHLYYSIFTDEVKHVLTFKPEPTCLLVFTTSLSKPYYRRYQGLSKGL